MEEMQEQLHDFVPAGHTRGALAPLLDGPIHSDAEMMNTIDSIYEAGFELISLMGEDE